MKKRVALYVLVTLFILAIYTEKGFSTEPVVIEFLYYSCPSCAGEQHEIYIYNSRVLNEISRDYGNMVQVRRIEFFSREGEAKRTQYNLGILDWDSIIVNYKVVINRYERVNETYLRKIVDYYLNLNSSAIPTSPPEPPPQPAQSLSYTAALTLAFIFGFFETFSPCLIILLSFVVSYTCGETQKFTEGFSKVVVFGVGFVFAAVFLGIIFGAVLLSMPTLRMYFMLVVSFFAIIFGLNSLSVLKVPLDTKPFLKNLVKKYAMAYMGILFLGFVFYFLDPCIAPILVSMAPVMLPNILPLVISMFCLGAILPFIGIGVFVGSISKLVRITYKHKSKIKAISGLILIGYAVYLIVSYLSSYLSLF